MNIFILDTDPGKCAEMHCDKHVIKMITESAQMLSTCHRVLDGFSEKQLSRSGKRMVTRWVHSDHKLDKVLYKSAYVNHPCNVWLRESSANYNFLYKLFCYLGDEYTHRTEKVHKSLRQLSSVLANAPKNIPTENLTQFANCTTYDTNDIVHNYRLFYIDKQNRFPMIWSKRKEPNWFVRNTSIIEV